MKFAECNARQKKAYANIYHAANWLIGGLENTLADHGKDDPEYKSAEARLADHDGLVAELYEAATTDLYGDGFCEWGIAVDKFLRDIRFCGKAWLMERCEARVKKCGY